MKKSKYVLIAFVGVFLFSSCSWLINSLIYNDDCQKCSLVDVFGNVDQTFTECGGSYDEASDDCKIAAYEKNQWNGGYTCNCETVSE